MDDSSSLVCSGAIPIAHVFMALVEFVTVVI